jgi:hypothetical protein
MSDRRANWSCQVDKRDGCARLRALPDSLPLRSPRPGLQPPAAQGPCHSWSSRLESILGIPRPGPALSCPSSAALSPQL